MEPSGYLRRDEIVPPAGGHGSPTVAYGKRIRYYQVFDRKEGIIPQKPGIIRIFRTFLRRKIQETNSTNWSHDLFRNVLQDVGTPQNASIARKPRFSTVGHRSEFRGILCQGLTIIDIPLGEFSSLNGKKDNLLCLIATENEVLLGLYKLSISPEQFSFVVNREQLQFRDQHLHRSLFAVPYAADDIQKSDISRSRDKLTFLDIEEHSRSLCIS